MIIKVFAVDKAVKKFQKETTKIARKLGKLLLRGGVVEVYLICGSRMKALNKKFRNKNKPTNVLSFVTPRGFPDRVLGEIYIDPVYIKKNNQNLAQMLAHGVLHILGYDHEKKNDRIKMEKMEQRLLQKLVNGK